VAEGRVSRPNERENARLRRAVSDLTLDKMILNEALRGKPYAPRDSASWSSTCARSSVSPSAGSAR